MHDPMTVAFEIKMPLTDYTLMTIWHKDPEADGTDDSCGWFMRSRHCCEETAAKLRSDFAFEWDADWGGWFNADGSPRLSVIAIALQMFERAAYRYFGNWKSAHKFMQNNMYGLIHFAENNVDSLHSFITQKYGSTERERRIDEAVAIVWPYVCRSLRPWCKHPRWHIHHWRITLQPWQQLRRRFWDKCCVCGKRGFPKGVQAIGNWGGDKIWHDTCETPPATGGV